MAKRKISGKWTRAMAKLGGPAAKPKAAAKSNESKAPRRAAESLCAVTGLPNSPAWFRKQAVKKKGKRLNGKWRTVQNVWNAKLEPYSLQGTVQPDLTWRNVSYDEKTGEGVFLIYLAPGAVSIPHEHIGFEEFLALEGSIIDSDGAVYKKGDFVSLKPGSKHLSYTPKGFYALVILRGGKPSRTLEVGEKLNIV